MKRIRLSMSQGRWTPALREELLLEDAKLSGSVGAANHCLQLQYEHSQEETINRMHPFLGQHWSCMYCCFKQAVQCAHHRVT